MNSNSDQARSATVDPKLHHIQKVLTFALLIDLIAFFLADNFMPNSHLNSPVWPIHSRFHVGAMATINGFYIFMALYFTWRPPANLFDTMRWSARILASWNIVFLLFAVLVVPFLLGPDDSWIAWDLVADGAGNDPHKAVEGMAFPMVGIPALALLYVLHLLKVYERNLDKASAV